MIAKLISNSTFLFYAGAYISETVHASHRNTLNSIQIVMVGLGSLFALVLGYLLDWRTIAFILAAVSFITSVSILLLPETPYYLIEKRRRNDARASLLFFRGSECNTVDQELEEIIEARDRKGSGLGWRAILKALTSHSFLKPFLCIGPIHFIFRYRNAVQKEYNPILICSIVPMMKKIGFPGTYAKLPRLQIFQVVILLHNLPLHDDISGQGGRGV